MAEAAQHQARISWYCQKGPLAGLGLLPCSSSTTGHLASEYYVCSSPGTWPALYRPDCKCFRQSAGQNDVITSPDILRGPSHPSPSSNTFSHESDTDDHSSVPSTTPPPHSPGDNSQETGWTSRMLSIAALHMDLRVSTSLPAYSPALLLAL